jgi:uncharacterized protein YecE (DUF72 family)
MSPHTSPQWPLFLGCPVWACDQWADEIYPAKTPRKQWLSWYSRTFNTVEGNSTFYGLPSRETTEKWAVQSAEGFRFCLKFPRVISHDLMLRNAHQETAAFLECMRPLADAEKLGPTFLQLGPQFAPNRFGDLEAYLNQLRCNEATRTMSWAVELRHYDWFDRAANEDRVNGLLRELEIDKVLFDSRPLFQSPPEDEIESASQARKPKTPVRQTVTAKQPMLRIVGRNRTERTREYFDAWAPIVAKWVSEGLTPYVFTHAPDDALAPRLGRMFARAVASHLDGLAVDVPRPPTPLRQMSLLDEE